MCRALIAVTGVQWHPQVLTAQYCALKVMESLPSDSPAFLPSSCPTSLSIVHPLTTLQSLPHPRPLQEPPAASCWTLRDPISDLSALPAGALSQSLAKT